MKYKFPVFISALSTPFLSIFLLMMLSFSAMAKTQAIATVSDNNIILGDMFILTVVINDKDDDYQLNTRVLEKEFTVYRPSRSQRSEYINGEFSQETEWQVQLQAKKTGELVIPALTIGTYKTEPISIKVSQPSQQATNVDNDSVVFMENSIDKQSVYIGQSFIFTTKLYISQNANELELIAPTFKGANQSVYGKDNNSQTVRNGVQYNTITRQYKMSATEAGNLEIDSPLLTGTLRKVVRVSDWQNRVIADPINVRGDQLNIQVKAIPEEFKGQWIVSDDLRLVEDNDLTQQSYPVGEPITRSITLQIEGIDKEKLPNIDLNYPSSLRVYPDQDQLEDGQANGRNYGVRIIRHAIIADKVGTLTLPEIKLNWWNSKTNQQQVAVLPAQTLTIIAAENKQVTPAPISAAPIVNQPATIIVDHAALIYWQICVAVLLIMILMMGIYHINYRRSQQRKQTQQKQPVAPLNQQWLTLQDCLKSNHAGEAYKALLNYAQYQYPTLKSLNQFSEKASVNKDLQQQLAAEIKILEKCCSEPNSLWDSAKLEVLLSQCHAQKQQENISNPMNLNP